MDIIVIDKVSRRIYSNMHEEAGKGTRLIESINRFGPLERYVITSMDNIPKVGLNGHQWTVTMVYDVMYVILDKT